MDAFHQSRRSDPPPPPPASAPQQQFWYPSASPPQVPPGGYHHPPPPQLYAPTQWNHSGESHQYPQPPPPYPHPPPPQNPAQYTAPQQYQNYSAPYPPPPLRYPPPHAYPSAYAPNQAWGNSPWAQHPAHEYPERNAPYNNEDAWAAKAKAWADAKPAIDYQHAPSQISSIGRTDEHNYAYPDNYQQGGGAPMDPQQLFPQSSSQQVPDFRKQDNLHEMASFNSGSSYRADGHVLPNAGVESTVRMSSSQNGYGPGSSIYEQEVPYIYSSSTGNKEAVDHTNLHVNLPLPMSSVQGLHSQTTLSSEQPPFGRGGQSYTPTVDPSDQPLDFEPRSSSGDELHHKISYGHTDPGDAIATSIHAWTSTSASGNFDSSYVSQSSLPIPPFAGLPGPNFRSPMQPASVPFGLASGTPVHALAFPGEGNGSFNHSERPKKAAVPSWLREAIIKEKAVIPSSVLSNATESSFHSVGSEDANTSYRTANQADNKSIDSAKSTEDEDDDEDNLEAARAAAINQQIKRVLTEVLLKVTDELFDEIATKVLNEDDVSVEVGESAVIGKQVSPTPPPVLTHKASAKVLVQVKKNGLVVDGASDDSRRSSPRGDILGLANYASDDGDDNEIESSGFLPSEVIVDASPRQERNLSHSENILKKVDTGSASLNSQGPGHDSRDTEYERNKPNADGIRLSSTSRTANNGKSNTEEHSTKELKTTSTGAYSERSTGRNSSKEVKAGKERGDDKISDASDSYIQEERSVLKRKMDKRDYPERFEDVDVKKGANERGLDSRSSSKHGGSKDQTKESSKDKREKERKDNERKREQTRGGKEERSARVMKHSSRYSSTTSSSPSNRGRKSNQNSSGGQGSASSGEPYENSKKRKMSSERRKLSRSPSRSSKRQVSRSPHSKQSHRRHSPYSSTERRRRSRSRSPVRHRSAYKHDK